MVFTESLLDPSILVSPIVHFRQSAEVRCGDHFYELLPKSRATLIGCRHYVPREFTLVVSSVLYIPPHANINQTLEELYRVIYRAETSRTGTIFT